MPYNKNDKKEAARLREWKAKEKAEWEHNRRLLTRERSAALNRIRVRGQQIKAQAFRNNKRTREINNQYERALTQVNQRYAKARGMKF